MNLVSQYRNYLWDYLERYHGLKNPKQFFRCLNPNHIDNHPSMIYTQKYNICKCFACGVSYDIFDLVGLDYNISNFRDQLLKLGELYNCYVPDNLESNDYVDNSKYDYTNYYKKCVKNISKTNYLQDRGIPNELITKYNIGYDKDKKLVIFPINKHCYFARSVMNNSKIKSKGKSDIWNKDNIKRSNKDTIVYVTESIIDGLSLETVDPNIKTVSINGVGNIHNFAKELKDAKFKGSVVISFDNDKAGKEASNKLKEELINLNINSFSNTLIDNFDAKNCKDLNQALIINKDQLKDNLKYFNRAYLKYINKQEGENKDYELE